VSLGSGARKLFEECGWPRQFWDVLYMIRYLRLIRQAETDFDPSCTSLWRWSHQFRDVLYRRQISVR